MIRINERPVKNILVKSSLPVSDYSANPYTGCEHACKYCYASFMKRFTNHAEAWGDFLDVKDWPEIRNPEKYAGKEIFLSSVTDPYQPAEKIYGRTRKLLEQLQGSGCKLSIATKSDLILRDLDLIRSFPDARVSWSINTLDDDFQKNMDEAVPIEQRIKAMQTFYEAGINTTCFISPIFPGISDPIKIIQETRKYCNLVWLENLNLRSPYKFEIMTFIKDNYPYLYTLYKEIYIHKDRSWWHELDKSIANYAKKENLPYLRNTDPILTNYDASPVIVNYFFHEDITNRT